MIDNSRPELYQPPKRVRPRLYKLAGIGLVVIAFFALGVAFGQERITFGRDRGTVKSVQKANPGKFDYAGIEDVYKTLRQNYDGQIDDAKLEDGLKQGLTKAAGDPYTEYLNKEDSQQFDNQLSGSFEGIGAELGKEEDAVVIIAPIAGFPAEKAGLKPRDIIYEINGKTAVDISVSEAVKQIRGPKGSKVKLTIVRAGQKLNFDITREQISIPSVTSEVVDNVGIIKISRFGEDTVALATKAAKDFKAQNVKGVILDLRGDPGGYLGASVGVSSLWLDRGKLVVEERRAGKVIKDHKATGNSPLLGTPTVVLIDEGSASASEIVAGALQDHKAATIMGVKSYGKGSVQQVLKLKSGGTLKVTVARWFTPSGRNIDKEGIEPDKKVELTADDAKAKRDPQKDAALSKLK